MLKDLTLEQGVVNTNGSRIVNVRNALTEKVKLLDLLSPELIQFSEAVTNPFGNNAIGAVFPDSFQELATPCIDKLNYDLDFTQFNLDGDWVNDQTDRRLLGVFVWLQPRCFASGTSLIDNAGTMQYPMFADQGYPLSSNDAKYLAHSYLLCYTGHWSNGTGENRTGFWSANGSTIETYYRVLPFPRIGNIHSNCAKGRLLGGAFKMWSEEAAINTGGYSVAGWLPMSDILDCVDTGASADSRGNSLSNIQQKIKGPQLSKGIEGITVRYSMLQDEQQRHAQPVKISSDQYTLSVINNIPNITAAQNVNMSVFDLMQSGSFVPACYWRFNNTNADTSTPLTSGLYTIKLLSVIHYEGSPKGDSPFMSVHVKKDPASDHIKSILEDWQMFPPATEGHSFSSFINKASHVVSKVTQGVGHFHKLMVGIDQFGRDMAPLIATGSRFV
jgi:hypothetical protein